MSKNDLMIERFNVWAKTLGLDPKEVAEAIAKEKEALPKREKAPLGVAPQAISLIHR